MPNVSNQAYVTDKLEPYFPLFRKVILTSWATYMDCMKNYPPFQYPRTRANVLWDWIITNIKNEFSEFPEIRSIEQTQTTWYEIDDIMFRVKKSNPDGYSRNYPTQQAMDLNNPNAQIDGVSDNRVELVYILNIAQTDIEDIRIVCRNDNKIEWQFTILTDEAIEEIHEHQFRPEAAAADRNSAPVEVKDDALQKDKKDDAENQ